MNVAINHHYVAGAEHRTDGPEICVIAGGKHQSGRLPEERRELPFEVVMQSKVPIVEPRSRAGRTEAVERRAAGIEDPWVFGQAEVVVRTAHHRLPTQMPGRRPVVRLERREEGVDARFYRLSGQCEVAALIEKVHLLSPFTELAFVTYGPTRGDRNCGPETGRRHKVNNLAAGQVWHGSERAVEALSHGLETRLLPRPTAKEIHSALCRRCGGKAPSLIGREEPSDDRIDVDLPIDVFDVDTYLLSPSQSDQRQTCRIGNTEMQSVGSTGHVRLAPVIAA